MKYKNVNLIKVVQREHHLLITAGVFFRYFPFASLHNSQLLPFVDGLGDSLSCTYPSLQHFTMA